MTASVEAPTRGERISGLVLGIAIHIGLLALILALAPAKVRPPIKTEGIALFNIGAEPHVETPPPPPKMPSKIPDKQVKVSPPALVYEESTAGTPSAGCATLASVSNALLTDPAAVTAIVNAPPDARSIAGAIALWNAGWAPTAALPGDVLGPARTAIEKTLGASPNGCLEEQIVGPRFIAIPVGERTTFIVLGSGQWTWRDMMADPFPPIDQPAVGQSSFLGNRAVQPRSPSRVN